MKKNINRIQLFVNHLNSIFNNDYRDNITDVYSEKCCLLFYWQQACFPIMSFIDLIANFVHIIYK